MHLGQMAVNENLLCERHLGICDSLKDQEAITWKVARPRHTGIKNDESSLSEVSITHKDEEQYNSLKKGKGKNSH